MIKTVELQVAQQSTEISVNAVTRLQLILTVENVDDGFVGFGVKY